VTIDKDTGEYTYTPDKDYGPARQFTVIVDDGKGGKTTTTVTVEFTPEQDVSDDTATTGYDKSVTIDVLGNDDFEGANVTITQVDGKAITEGGPWPDRRQRQAGGRPTGVHAQGGLCGRRQVQLHGADRWRHARDRPTSP
jgi:hypothetical protein